MIHSLYFWYYEPKYLLKCKKKEAGHVIEYPITTAIKYKTRKMSILLWYDLHRFQNKPNQLWWSKKRKRLKIDYTLLATLEWEIFLVLLSVLKS